MESKKKNVIVNDLYLQWVLQPSYETIAVCGILILAIVLFSVVVIYNIFQVGIANKIQEYGKIKALGATKKQMKQLIFREGMFLTIFSIPVGLLLGFLIAKCGFNWLVEQGNLVSTKLALWESKISRCHCFPCLLYFYVFSYHFLPLLWHCANQ